MSKFAVDNREPQRDQCCRTAAGTRSGWAWLLVWMIGGACLGAEMEGSRKADGKASWIVYLG